MKSEIFVEGISDERLISQYCSKLKHDGLIAEGTDIHVQSTGGWDKINSPKGESFVNLMKKNKTGKNLIIFDADNDSDERRSTILKWKEKFDIEFELFLFPDDNAPGTVETLLERIINPDNQCVIDCWHAYEESLGKQVIDWKEPPTPTCPSEKSKIYGYLETLVGSSKSEKEKIKDANRDFTLSNHWDLDSENIRPLKEFLLRHLGTEK